MRPQADALVYIVDDDASVREALAWLLRSRRLLSETYASALAFEARLLASPDAALAQPCCLLLDVRMPGLSGLALFERLTARGLHTRMPVIFLTGHADVPTAVETVRKGALDFCEKPFSNNALVDRVEQALALSAAALQRHQQRCGVQARLHELSAREQEVMQRVAQGLPNKRIADALGISVRTVEVHRARIFEKTGVKSAVELVQLLRDADVGTTADVSAPHGPRG